MIMMLWADISSLYAYQDGQPPLDLQDFFVVEGEELSQQEKIRM